MHSALVRVVLRTLPWVLVPVVAVPALVVGSPGAAGAGLPSAAPQPIAPRVQKTALAGVDAAALAGSPAALDPVALSASDQGRSVPVGRASSDRKPTVLTAEIAAPRFEAAGVSWTVTPSSPEIVVQVRIREKGQWSDWQALDVADGPDQGSRDAARAGTRVATEPITTASADRIQVRVDTDGGPAPADLQLVTVDPGTSTADATVTAGATAAAAVAAPAARPVIVTRAQWGAEESMRDCDPTYSDTIKAGVVHHTVNSNSYAAADVPGLIRAMYAYHVNGNGWCDIGYNFLVDRFGRVYEGRAGGVDRPVIGAHAGGFNTFTFGVSGIGDFTSVQPSASMVTGIAAVLGWKLSLYAVDPQSTTVLISGGGPYTQWPQGTAVTVRTVSGHRDLDATGCPGDTFYPKLPDVAALARRHIATTSPASLVLNPGTVRRSPDGRFEVVMQYDGNLVVYGPTGATWASHTGIPYAYAVVQADGNLVVYDQVDGGPLWSANGSGLYAHLEMQNDGNLVLYAGSGAALWDARGYVRRATTTFAPNKAVISSLNQGEQQYAPNRAYRLAMQVDGNLVEYDSSNRPRWASNTNVPGSRVVLQSDGNLVVYGPQNQPLWSSGTGGNAGAWAAIRTDGGLRVYRPDGTAAWAA